MDREYLKDTAFLRELDKNRNRFTYTKIIVLDMEERPISAIEGRVLGGSSLNIEGNSSTRRSCSLTFIALEEENDLTDIDNLLSINKKVKVEIGVENNFPCYYTDKIFWFPMGTFVITTPTITHNTKDVRISLTLKDKMSLLNGDCGGMLPASVTFHEYDQLLGELKVTDWPDEPNNYTVYNFGSVVSRKEVSSQYWRWEKTKGWFPTTEDDIGETVSEPNLIYDIIQTCVCFYGGENINKIIINDVPREIKQLVRNTSGLNIYYNTLTGEYSCNQSLSVDTSGKWLEFEPEEDVGYVYTDFTYPGQLVSNIGDTIVSILDKIKNTLGNYEYFYDLDGNFVFQEKKNYLNNSYLQIPMSKTVIPVNYKATIFSGSLAGIIDYNTDKKREDFIVQTINTKGCLLGQEDNNFYITYPSVDGVSSNRLLLSYVDAAWSVVNNLYIIDGGNYLVDYNSNKKTAYDFLENDGLITQFANVPDYSKIKNDFHVWGKDKDSYGIHYHLVVKSKPPMLNTYKVVVTKDKTLDIDLENGQDYQAQDWRVELYLQGKMKAYNQIRPDIYEQELIDLLPTIYEWEESGGQIIGKYKFEVNKVNELKYFIDYLEPIDNLYDCSVDLIGKRSYTYQQDNIVRLYNKDVPNVIIVNIDGDPTYNAQILARCKKEGQPHSNIDGNTFGKITIGTRGYNAQEVARDLLYQYTDYNSSITLSSVPIFYLEPNTRISVMDRKSNISGDYIIGNIMLPLDGKGTMSIKATRALEKI